MRFVIYGAGGIGATIGGRLFQQGFDVVLIARGEHGVRLRDHGLTLIAPDGEHQIQVPTVLHPKDLQFQPQDLVFLTMKSQHTAAALEDLAGLMPGDIGIVCGQNGVANERMALRRFRRVYAMLISLPALHLEPGVVITYADGKGGILDSGCYPEGVDDTVVALTGALEQAGFSARPSPQVMRQKYAKLVSNMGNALEVVAQPGSASAAIRRHLIAEALACYDAAGIDCATKDQVRERAQDGPNMVDIAGYPRGGGSSWQSANRGADNVETDYLNGEIVLLGRLYDVPTPANEVIQQSANHLVRTGLPVGSFSAELLLKKIAVGD